MSLINAVEKARQQCVIDTMYDPIEFVFHPEMLQALRMEIGVVHHYSVEKDTLLGIPVTKRVINPPAALRTKGGDLVVIEIPRWKEPA